MAARFIAKLDTAIHEMTKLENVLWLDIFSSNLWALAPEHMGF